MQVLACNNNNVFSNLHFENVVTIHTLNAKKIHIKYDPNLQSIGTIWRWFFNHFKYQCAGYQEKNFKFVNEYNVEMPVTDDIDKSKSVLGPEKKIRLMLKVETLPPGHENNSINCINYEYKAEKFIESSTSTYIYIKTLTGKSHLVHLNDITNTCVGELKLHIQDMEGVPPDQQRIIYNGRQLEEDNKISVYNPVKGSTFHLVLRLRGGMYNEVSGRNGAYEPLGDIFFDISKEPVLYDITKELVLSGIVKEPVMCDKLKESK